MDPPVSVQSTQRNQGLHERGGTGGGPLVTVPAAVGPLHVHQSIDQHLGALVFEAQSQRVPDGVALHRGATPYPVRLIVVEDGAREPHVLGREHPLVHLVAQRKEAFITRRVFGQGQLHQGPVWPLPLGVRIGGNRAIRAAVGQQPASAFAVGHGSTKPGEGVLRLAQQIPARFQHHGLIVRVEQPLHDG